ncbi:MAG: hypothetical protein QOD84_1025 [Acidobacteriaceae bacterium]|jgi:hypothetical protein
MCLKTWAKWAAALHDAADLPAKVPILAPVQLVPFQHSILVIPENSSGSSKAPILEVRDSGSIRAIRLVVPDVYSVDSFIPSNDHWYVRFKVTPATKNVSSTDFVYDPPLFEVNPADGTLLRELQAQPVLTTGIACAHDEKFIAFRLQNERFVGMRGEIEHP